MSQPNYLVVKLPEDDEKLPVVFIWTFDQVLAEITRHRPADGFEVDFTNWEDGWGAFVEIDSDYTMPFRSPVEIAPIDMIIPCPQCGFQHVDRTERDKCKNCGISKYWHNTSEVPSKYKKVCGNFEPWLNEPHQKHRCARCNNVFRTANIPTNGVISLEEVANV